MTVTRFIAAVLIGQAIGVVVVLAGLYVFARVARL